MTSVIEIIAGTPWWVYVLFVFLMRIAFLSTKPQIIDIKQLYILPAIFCILSIVSIYYISSSFNHFIYWLPALTIGVAFGWLHYRLLNIKAIPSENKIVLPGTWSVFIIILVIFAAKYYMGFKMSIDSSWLSNPKVIITIASLYGLCTGLFIGRASYARKCLRVGPYAS